MFRPLSIDEMKMVAGGIYDSTEDPRSFWWEPSTGTLDFYGAYEPYAVNHDLNGDGITDQTDYYTWDGSAIATGITEDGLRYYGFDVDSWNENLDPLEAYGSIGGGIYGVVAGGFYSETTGVGLYVGIGTPGLDYNFGLTNDATGYLTGVSGNMQLISWLGAGSNFDGSYAYSVGNPSLALTYGITAADIFEAVNDIGSYFYNSFDNILDSVSDGFYDMLGNPYDPPGDDGDGDGGGGGGGGGGDYIP